MFNVSKNETKLKKNLRLGLLNLSTRWKKTRSTDGIKIACYVYFLHNEDVFALTGAKGRHCIWLKSRSVLWYRTKMIRLDVDLKEILLTTKIFTENHCSYKKELSRTVKFVMSKEWKPFSYTEKYYRYNTICLWQI